VKGTPGFVGERLREAREARGLTAIALAEILGITRQAVSLYESGESSPQPDMMPEIADKLSLPSSFFMRSINKQNPNAVFFRSMAAATKSDRGRGGSRIKWLSEILVPYLRQFVSFPKVNLPVLPTPNNPLQLSNDDIEELAAELRRSWGLGEGPISNVVLLLENNGCLVTRMDLDSPALDAFSTYSVHDNTPYIILGANKGSAVRSRFDAAHENAHLVLHKKFRVDRLRNPAEFKMAEQQANRFASAFLVPGNKFADDFSVPTLDAFQALKAKWLVSIGMLIMRAYQLGFISEAHSQRLWINYNRRGWRKAEPLDDKLPIEQPVVLRRACKLIIEAKVRTPQQLLADIPLSAKDVEELLYVPKGYLAPSLPKVQLKNVPISGDDSQAAVEEVERLINGF
jgi:Zn-dependent peptidase ImmA (M78 family)/DNA-binding XRE family transcriptional regulator